MDNVVIFLVVVGMPLLPFVLAIATSFFYHSKPGFRTWHDRYLGGE